MNTIELLRDADPASDLPAYSADDASALLARVTRPRRTRRHRVAPLSTAACLALLVALLPTWWPQGGATARASDLLDRAVVAAYDPPARPDQYWRVTTRSITSDIIGDGSWGEPDTVSALRWVRRVEYVAVNEGRPSWFVDRAGPYVRQVSGPTTRLPNLGWGKADTWTTNLTPPQLEPAQWSDFPLDTDALRARLYQAAQGHGQSSDGEVVVLIADALRTGRVPAAMRQAMFRVLKTVPGVDLGPSPVTLDGRTGVALGRMEAVGDVRQELIFDPHDASLIGERRVFTRLPGEPALESGMRRVLVDDVPDSVRRVARHEVCTFEPDGALTCT